MKMAESNSLPKVNQILACRHGETKKIGLEYLVSFEGEEDGTAKWTSASLLNHAMAEIKEFNDKKSEARRTGRKQVSQDTGAEEKTAENLETAPHSCSVVSNNIVAGCNNLYVHKQGFKSHDSRNMALVTEHGTAPIRGRKPLKKAVFPSKRVKEDSAVLTSLQNVLPTKTGGSLLQSEEQSSMNPNKKQRKPYKRKKMQISNTSARVPDQATVTEAGVGEIAVPCIGVESKMSKNKLNLKMNIPIASGSRTQAGAKRKYTRKPAKGLSPIAKNLSPGKSKSLSPRSVKAILPHIREARVSLYRANSRGANSSSKQKKNPKRTKLVQKFEDCLDNSSSAFGSITRKKPKTVSKKQGVIVTKVVKRFKAGSTKEARSDSIKHSLASKKNKVVCKTDEMAVITGATYSRELNQETSQEKKRKYNRKRKLVTDDSEEDVLYSINEDYYVEKSKGKNGKGNRKGDSPPLKKKKIVEEVDVSDTDSTDSEIVFKSPRKMLLKDSIRPKTKAVRRVAGEIPVADPSLEEGFSRKSPVFFSETMAYKTPPSSPRSHSPVSLFEAPSAPQAETAELYTAELPKAIPILPSSPPSHLSYEKLIKNLPQKLQANKGFKRKNSDSSAEEPIERRVSVRQSESAFKYKEIMVRKCQGYTQIFLISGSKTRYALNPQVFSELNQALSNAKYDDSKLVMLSGCGSVFCPGIDLKYLQTGDRREAARKMAESIRDFVSNMIAFPKPIVAAVNGPAIGLGMALLPLCDIIYASDKATFSCPYSHLAQTPEGCASYTFPHIMGMAMANEILLAGRRLTAIEAYQIGLVSQVFWPTSLMQEVVPRVQKMASQSAKALEAGKLLIRSHQRSKLEMTNQSEFHMLIDRWSSNECQRAITQYLETEADF